MGAVSLCMLEMKAIIELALSCLLVQAVTGETHTDIFTDQTVKMGKMRCVCDFIFEVEGSTVSKEGSSASCNVECSGKTKRKIVLIDYETGHKFTLKITVEEGEVTKMSLPKYEELIAPGSPELCFFEGDMKLNADQIALLKKTEIHDPAYATDNKPKNTEEEIVIQSPNNEEPSGNAVIGTHYRWPQRRVTYQLH